jgi:hypothetical protein
MKKMPREGCKFAFVPDTPAEAIVMPVNSVDVEFVELTAPLAPTAGY